MNDIYVPNDPDGVFHAIYLPEFGFTWAGANPLGEGFCFGSENGEVVFADVAGQPLSLIKGASASKEAVNGLAFSQNWLAVTTRKDINFIGPCLPRTQPPDVVTFSCGGRDVIVAPISGYFLVPLGPDGIMFVKPGTDEKDPLTISRPKENGLNVCRVLALAANQATDVIVCAGRRGGLGYAEFREGIRGHTMHTVAFNGMDLVDVCSVATLEKPLAVVATAKDCSLVFFDNILTDKMPKTIKFNGIKGSAYRILSARGDIYLLTSKGLFGLFRLAGQFLKGETLHHATTDILRMPIGAADANMVGKRWLLAVGTDAVFRLDLDKLPKSPDEGTIARGNGDLKQQNDARMQQSPPALSKLLAPNGSEQPEEIRIQPRWTESTLAQTSEHIVSA
jgi:hypothetical protein